MSPGLAGAGKRGAPSADCPGAALALEVRWLCCLGSTAAEPTGGSKGWSMLRVGAGAGACPLEESRAPYHVRVMGAGPMEG